MRTFAIGDPQAAFATVMAVLDAHHLLGADGMLADGIHLISIGDHFDYDWRDPITAGEQGLRVLRWLASHPPDRVSLLLGNHDVVRVMELATIDDVRFAEARALGLEIAADRATAAGRVQREFLPRFPELPTIGLPSRDYASFSVAQRDLVIELILAGRFQLARAQRLLDGRDVLLTHAGITERELAMLGIPDERDAITIAGALEAHLARAVDTVREAWAHGVVMALSLAPLHVAGSAGHEGGGLLYHRPSNPTRRDAQPWSIDRPRRFDPRSLPRGLVQIAGHSGHNKCLEELGDWATPAAIARPRGGIRTLATDGTNVVYDLGVGAPDPALAQLVLIDGEMRRVSPVDYPVLELS